MGHRKMDGKRDRSRGLDLSYSLEPDVPHQILGDPARLKQILVNLLGNAVKFTDRKSVV